MTSNISNRVSRVCDQCSKIKQRCDGSVPCHRCQRLSLDCQYSGSRTAGGYNARPLKGHEYDHVNHEYFSSSHTKVPQRRSAVIRRTRNGCSSCKARKKKCDEVLPKCGDCKRLNLHCSRTTIKSPSAVSNIHQHEPFHCQSATESDGIEFQYVEEHVSPRFGDESPLDGNTSGSSDESGSVTYSKAVLPRSSDFALPFDRISSEAPFRFLDSKDQHLLRHFIRVVSRTLSVVHEDATNPFVSLIIPLAGSCSVVLESLLALSASHLRRIYPKVLQRGLSHQNEALASLNRLISQKSPNSSEETLAAVLILCMIEICDGNSTKWSWHIGAAQTIIRSRKKCVGSNTSTWRFLLAMFGYVDSVITISKCQAPLIAPEELVENESSAVANSPGPVATTSKSHNEALFGVALPLFTIIGQISELAHRRKDRVDELSELWFRQSATRIEASLRGWKPEPPLPQSSRFHTNQDLIDAAYAIQWASILRLHQVVEGYSRSDPQVIESTCQILEHISKIRFGSPAESILIFPLVMAGSGCQDDEQRMMVRERWMVMERTIGFDNVYRARQMVEAVWKEVDQGELDGSNDGGTTVNWAKIRHYDFPGVVLL